MSSPYQSGHNPNPYAPGYRKKIDPMFTPPVNPAPPAAVPATPTAPAKNVRIGDAERNDAIEALGSHFAVGRLKLNEYDERIAAAFDASTSAELDELFADLPTLDANAERMPMYSAAEVERLHEKGRNKKLGVFLLASLGGMAVGTIGTIFNENAFGLIAPFVILAAWVMLYVLKLGPDEWHVPSSKQLNRERMRQLRIEQVYQREQRRLNRREMTGDIADSALRFARDRLNRR